MVLGRFTGLVVFVPLGLTPSVVRRAALEAVGATALDFFAVGLGPLGLARFVGRSSSSSICISVFSFSAVGLNILESCASSPPLEFSRALGFPFSNSNLRFLLPTTEAGAGDGAGGSSETMRMVDWRLASLAGTGAFGAWPNTMFCSPARNVKS